eukprot:980844_1
MAFSLVYPGCTDNGITEIRDTMGYPDDGTNMQLVWADATQRMLSHSAGQCLDSWCSSDAPLLKIANSVWVDASRELSNSYFDVVGNLAKQIDFEAADSPVIVNKWVSDSTEGLIKSIVPEDKPLFPPYVLVAINSIYLKARWEKQFSEYSTNLDSFYSSSSRNTDEASDAHFMNTVGYFPYSHDALPGYQVIGLPFADSGISMIFVLPVANDAAADGDAVSVTSTNLIGALDDMEFTRVALSLPKFKFESTYSDNLKSALVSAGIIAPFTKGSGALCGMFKPDTNCDQLIIDQVVQKTVIDVNEKGVEATAATMVGVGLTSAGDPDANDPIIVLLDHQFQFFIYDESEDLMLFEGRLGAPEIPEAEPATALMDGKHSDIDFWWEHFRVEAVDPTGSTSDSRPTEQSSEPTSSPNPVTQPSKAPIVLPTTTKVAGQPSIVPTTKPLAASPTSSPTNTLPPSFTNATSIVSEPPTFAPNKVSESTDISKRTVSSDSSLSRESSHYWLSFVLSLCWCLP